MVQLGHMPAWRGEGQRMEERGGVQFEEGPPIPGEGPHHLQGVLPGGGAGEEEVGGPGLVEPQEPDPQRDQPASDAPGQRSQPGIHTGARFQGWARTPP
jgi:hypothetical protein